MGLPSPARAFLLAAALVLTSGSGAVAAPAEQLGSAPSASSSGTTLLVSTRTDGSQATGGGQSPRITASGREVLWVSLDLRTDSEFAPGIFVFDIATGAQERVSIHPGGQPANSTWFGMSRDGRFVAFVATPFDDFARNQQLYLRDRVERTTRLVSARPDGAPSDFSVYSGSDDIGVSADGRYVMFASQADDLDPAAPHPFGSLQVFLRDMSTGTTRQISAPTGTETGARPGALADDGSIVVYSASAALTIYDVASRTRSAVRQSNGAIVFADAGRYGMSLSEDARLLAFIASHALVPPDTNGSPDAYVYDRVASTFERVSVGPGGEQANSATFRVNMTPDGRYVAFESFASNLIGDADLNGRTDVFVKDRATGNVRLGSISRAGSSGNNSSSLVTVSADGSRVAFESRANDLIERDTGTFRDAFVRVFGAPNAAPVVDAGADLRTAPGASVERTGTFADPDAGQSWTAQVDYGDGTGLRPLALASNKSFSLSYAYGIGGPYHVRVYVTDSAGAVGVGGFTVTIENTIPRVNAGGNAGAYVRVPFVRDGSFEDADAGQTWTATVDYGDGAGAEPLALVGKTFRLEHVYTRARLTTVIVEVTDSFGGRGRAVFDISISPSRSFLFLHGIKGEHDLDPTKLPFNSLQRPLMADFAASGQVAQFQYWQDKGDAFSDTRVCDPGERRSDLIPADSYGLPVTRTDRSRSAEICDSQSDVGINAILLDRDVLAQHAKFGGKVTLIANSMGGAIVRAYLAYAVASGSESVRWVDQVVFLQGAQQGSFLAAFGTELATGGSVLTRALVQSAAAVARPVVGFDLYSPAREDLTPRSEVYRWVNPDPAHVPSGIEYLNVASDIGWEITTDLLGHRLRLGRISLGDLVMLPGESDPRATPHRGGGRFDPRVIGRGAPGTYEWILRHDLPASAEAFLPAIEDGDPIPPPLDIPESHLNLGGRLSEIRVGDRSGSPGALSDVLLEAIRRLGR